MLILVQMNLYTKKKYRGRLCSTEVREKETLKYVGCIDDMLALALCTGGTGTKKHLIQREYSLVGNDYSYLKLKFLLLNCV